MGTKVRRWPVPLLSAVLLSLYCVVLFSLSYFIEGHVKVDTFYRAIWCSFWGALICFHLAWYVHRGNLSERAKLLSVVKMAIWAIIAIGGLAALISTSIVHDWLAAIPCIFWLAGSAVISCVSCN